MHVASILFILFLNVLTKNASCCKENTFTNETNGELNQLKRMKTPLSDELVNKIIMNTMFKLSIDNNYTQNYTNWTLFTYQSNTASLCKKIVNVSTSEVTFDSLNPNTTYYFYVIFGKWIWGKNITTKSYNDFNISLAWVNADNQTTNINVKLNLTGDVLPYYSQKVYFLVKWDDKINKSNNQSYDCDCNFTNGVTEYNITNVFRNSSYEIEVSLNDAQNSNSSKKQCIVKEPTFGSKIACKCVNFLCNVTIPKIKSVTKNNKTLLVLVTNNANDDSKTIWELWKDKQGKKDWLIAEEKIDKNFDNKQPTNVSFSVAKYKYRIITYAINYQCNVSAFTSKETYCTLTKEKESSNKLRKNAHIEDKNENSNEKFYFIYLSIGIIILALFVTILTSAIIILIRRRRKETSELKDSNKQGRCTEICVEENEIYSS